MSGPLPQEFPRELALLRLDDVLPELPPAARTPYQTLFEQRQAEPLHPGGAVLQGEGGLRPLMALMRLVVLRFRDLNLERFPEQGGQARLLTAYARGANLREPLPERASALFIERADQADPALAGALGALPVPIFASWEGPPQGPLWDTLLHRCTIIQLG